MGVLIVDDEAELADAIATYLQAFGFEAEYVVDGASALAAFDACPPKMVVLDVNLPIHFYLIFTNSQFFVSFFVKIALHHYFFCAIYRIFYKPVKF